MPTVTPTPGGSPSSLGNISTRLNVQTGENVAIGGFIINGLAPKKVIIRAIGPSLPSIVTNKLADPILELRGPGGLIATNDNWRSAQQAEIIASTVPPSNDAESAIVATLPAEGAGYTAIMRGVGNTSGTGLVEVYDLDPNANSKLANLSTRGLVQTGESVMIGGLILAGESNRRLIVRVVGPSLPVTGKLADPVLEVFDRNGTSLGSNDNWRTGGQEAEIIATTVAPTNDLEPALIVNLPAGAQSTVVVQGKNATTGVALVEAYALSSGQNTN